MPKYILVKCRATQVKDIEITDGLLVTSYHDSLPSALEELVYDPGYDWVIIEAKPSSSYTANVKITSKRDPKKEKKVGRLG